MPKLENIADQQISEMDEPDQEIVENYEAKQEEIPERTDKHGNPFDPQFHQVDSEGNPKLTTAGYCKIKPGKAEALGVSKKSRVGGGGSQTQGGGYESMTPEQQSYVSGIGAAQTFFALSQGVFGEEWKPTKQEENTVQDAFGRYFQSKDMRDIPPGVALSMAIVSYSIPRFFQPKTKTRIQRFKEWVGEKILKMRRKRKDKKQKKEEDRENAAHNDPGADRERKNDFSNEASIIT